MKRKYILLLVAAMAAFGAYAQHEPVDLGLSVDWASCNLGASAPEQYGAYYSWGETATKSVFSWNTYRYGNSDALTKYNKSDGNRTLAPENDAASAAWGGTWRMPTKAECAELLDKCTWTWSNRSGVNGYIVTGPSGNTIFLPASGQREGSEASDVGSWGCYWSATLNHRSILVAESLSFDQGLSSVEVASRIVGQAIRPVCTKNSVEVSLPDPSTYVDLGLSVKWATCNIGAKNPWECGDYYAWGETTTKPYNAHRNNMVYYDSYYWSNYKFGDKDFIAKYTDMDGKNILDKDDDVASVRLGTLWRMPNEAEFKELKEKCAWKWVKWYDMQGYKIVGPNGKYIFLPAAGDNSWAKYVGNTRQYDFSGKGYGSYWTCERGGENYGVVLWFSEEYNPSSTENKHCNLSINERCSGCTVRPVFK